MTTNSTGAVNETNKKKKDDTSVRVSNSSTSFIITLAMTNFVLEIVHICNSIPVKQRWEKTWQIHSMVDSYVLHTMMFLVMARYFRCWTWQEAVFFALSRILAEGYLPAEYGGMMSIKERAGRNDLGGVNYATSGACYIIIMAVTMTPLLRGKLLHPLFLGLGVWGYMFTILPAGKYFSDGVSWGYWLAHFANMITFNPSLVALILGYTDGPAAPPSKGTTTEHEVKKVH